MTRIDRIQLTYQLTFTMPFHCGTGLRIGLIDRTIVRDHDGYLYVPGSTIKGVLREYCEQLAHLYEEFDEKMDDAIASPHDEKRALWALGRYNRPTMITRIFGSHSSPSRLFFDDARQTDIDKGFYDSRGHEKYRSLQTDLATQVRIDRPSRTSVRGALYTSEFGIKDLTFTGSIKGWLECTPIGSSPDSPTYSLLLLLAGLHLIERIGGNKSTGKGQCRCEITTFTCGDETYEKARWVAWLDSLEELSYYSSYGVSQEEEL
jgi:CRISPR/Cas system CMR subunit Cmr4 (Cas7 group RAMP superfamily)